jgi:hypothetical protein
MRRDRASTRRSSGRAVDAKALRRYAAGHTLEIRSTAGDVIVAVSVESDRESFDTADDGSSWLSSLIGLRADLASGDERFHLGWMLDVQCGEIKNDMCALQHLGCQSRSSIGGLRVVRFEDIDEIRVGRSRSPRTSAPATRAAARRGRSQSERVTAC